MLSTEVFEILKTHKKELNKLGVKTIAIFGSVVRDENTPESDIDVLVNFDPEKGLFVFVDLNHFLETILHRKVDLVTQRALHPALRDSILDEVKYAF